MIEFLTDDNDVAIDRLSLSNEFDFTSALLIFRVNRFVLNSKKLKQTYQMIVVAVVVVMLEMMPIS